MFDRIIGTETEFGFYHDTTRGVQAINPDALHKLTCFELLKSQSMENMDATYFYNGGRFFRENTQAYVALDMLFGGFTPEYATPECRSVKDAVCWDKAGEKIMQMLLCKDRNSRVAKHGRGKEITFQDSDSEAVSGHHENYSVSRKLSDCEELFFQENSIWTKRLLTFLVSRVILHGAGWVDPSSRPYGYEISSRTDYNLHSVHSNSVSERGIICTGRTGENLTPDLEMTRMHLILGDHNMSEMALYLTLGTTSLLLWMIEERFIDDCPIIIEPVNGLHAFSKDIFFNHKARLMGSLPSTRSEYASALDLQEYFCAKAKEFVDINLANSEYSDIVLYWDDVLKRLKQDIYLLNGELDWVTKLCLTKDYLRRRNIDLEDTYWGRLDRNIANQCASLDLAYHFVDEGGLYNKLARAGKVKRLLMDQEIENAVWNPPQNTRAKIRSDFLRFLKQFNLTGGLTSRWERLNLFLENPNDEVQIPIHNPFDNYSQLWEDVKEKYKLRIRAENA